MAFEFKLPDIGEGVAEGEIVRWFVAEGDRVERDQPMVEVLTDKANVEIPAPRAGTILRILAAEGQIVPVESTLVVIGDPGESVPAKPAREGKEPPEHAHLEDGERDERESPQRGAGASQGAIRSPQAEPGAPGTQAEHAPAPVKQALREQPEAPRGPQRRADGGGSRGGDGRSVREGAAVTDGAAVADGAAAVVGDAAAGLAHPRRISRHDRVLAMPGVRRFARERGVDLSELEGSGSQGHILRADVERFLAEARATSAAPARGRIETDDRDEERPATTTPTAATAATPPAARQPIPRRAVAGPEEEVIPYRGVRRQIGRKMSQSVYTAPHYTYVEEVNADALVQFRRESQAFAEERGVKLTYLPFIMKALVPCLRTYPLLNAVLDEEGQQIRLKKRYNLGIATSSEDGLIVPVVKDVDQLSILEIAGEIRRLSEAARDRSITIEELKGSTFTITSLGPLGGLLATPIINYPEVAILGVHAIKQKPVVKGGQIVIGNVMNLSLSFDHRVVDGAVGAEFTRMLVRYLEDPRLLLLEA